MESLVRAGSRETRSTLIRWPGVLKYGSNENERASLACARQQEAAELSVLAPRGR